MSKSAVIETSIAGVELGTRLVHLVDDAAALVFDRFAYHPKVKIKLEVVDELPAQSGRRSYGDLCILDATCGARSMWFTPTDDRVVFMDSRREERVLSDKRRLVVAPDVMGDFQALPFSDGQFTLVVFDPPHLERLGAQSYMYAKYGALLPGWREHLKAGFSEVFRVLRPGGVLVFKWSEYQIPLTDILDLAPCRPLFGHRSGKRSQTHWVIFMKDNENTEWGEIDGE